MQLLEKVRNNQDLDLSILLLQYIGLLSEGPDAKKTSLKKLRSAGIVFIFVFAALSCSVLRPLGAIMSRNDLIAVFQCIGMSCLELLIVAKVVCFFLRGNEIRNLASRMVTAKRRDNGSRMSEEKQKIFTNIQWWINACVVLTVLVSFQQVSGSFPLIQSFVVKRKHYSRIWFPIDPYLSPTYEIVLGLEVVMLFISTMANDCVDGFLAATALYLVGQFRLLSHDLSRIKEDAVEELEKRRKQEANEKELLEKTHGSDQASSAINTLKIRALKMKMAVVKDKDIANEMTSRLRDCVYRYQECVGFVREFEKIFSLIFITEIFVSVVCLLSSILFAGIDLTTFDDLTGAVEKEEQRSEHLTFVMHYFAIVGALYFGLGIGCYLTDMITEESEAVREAVYACDWLASTSSFKKSMMIVISRANQPVFVKAAGFVPMTLETFLGITNLAYSYYNTLNAAVYGEASARDI